MVNIMKFFYSQKVMTHLGEKGIIVREHIGKPYQ